MRPELRVELTAQQDICSCGKHGHLANSIGWTSEEYADKQTAHGCLVSAIRLGQVLESNRMDLQFQINRSRLPLYPKDVDAWVRQQVNRLNRAAVLDEPLQQADCLLDAAAGIEG